MKKTKLDKIKTIIEVCNGDGVTINQVSISGDFDNKNDVSNCQDMIKILYPDNVFLTCQMPISKKFNLIANIVDE